MLSYASPSFLNMINKKSAVPISCVSIPDADCPFRLFRENQMLSLGYHIRRAALDKIIKVIEILIYCHDDTLPVICCKLLYTDLNDLSSAFFGF